MDLARQGQQPASQRYFPRQRRPREPGRAVHLHPAVRQHQSGGPVEMDGCLRKENRRQRPGHRAQREPEQRGDVSDCRGVRQSDRSRVCRNAREVGAALRDHADEGRRRSASLPLTQRRVRRLRTVGQRQPRRQRGEEEGDARIRIHPFGAQERPQARGETRREPLQVRSRRQQRRAHRPRVLRGGQFLRQGHDQRAQRASPDRHFHEQRKRPA